MKELKFKTNINCGGCVAKVTPFLDAAAGAGSWNVDISHPDRILSVKNAEEKKILSAIAKSGYTAKKI